MSNILEDTEVNSGRLAVGQGESYKNIIQTTSDSSTLSQVKTGAGYLHAIIVNSAAAGAITVYDGTSTSGTKIATLKASVAEGTYMYNVKFSTGLRVEMASNPNITVSYR